MSVIAWAQEPQASRTAKGADWWAYRPLVRPQPPAVKDADWVQSPIDAFVLHRIEERGLKPVGPASKIALLRRAYYDLTGLPPSPAEVDAFVADTRSDAFALVVDRLLASPQYGEKWARHWLDLVRYAETNGYERDGTKPFAWRYRDYTIRSFNEDKPFDRFIREQIAGDELEPPTADSITATGFYRLGLWDDEPVDALQARYDELDDIVATTAQVFLAMTVNCARCHDHKADPISQQDYYRLLAFFQDVPRYGDRSISEKHVLTDISDLTGTAEQNRRRTELIEQKEAIVRQMTALEQQAIAKMPAEDQRATEGAQRAQVLKEKLHLYLTDDENKQYRAWKKQAASLDKELAAASQLALSVNNCAVNPPETHVLARGSAHAPTTRVEPGFPRVLAFPDPEIERPSTEARTSRRRTALADWLTHPSNPLTARVMANRLWQHHFGRGLAPTTNDFGKLGERPTHPELLDWLAAELIEPTVSLPSGVSAAAGTGSPTTNQAGDAATASHAWRLKRMHRLIMLSRAYQMSSQDDVQNLRVDPSNELFWRFDMRRLSAEELRDSILAASGSLNLKMGGPSIYTEVPRAVLQTASRPDHAWGQSPPDEQARRSIYVFVKRSLPEPVLNTFDVPDPDSSCAVRFATTVPTQSLTSLNSEFFNKQAKLLAARLRSAASSPHDQVRLGLRLVTLRPPTESEVSRCVALFDQLQTHDGLSASAALDAVCLMLLNLNEFVYLD